MKRLKRPPTEEELEFTKWLRTFKPGNLSNREMEFMDQAYFDIQDGVSKENHIMMIRLAKRFHKQISKDLLCSILYSEKKNTTPPIIRKTTTWLDLHSNIMKIYYSFAGNNCLTEKDVSLIHREVCNKLGVDYEAAIQKSKKTQYVLSRQITCFICNKKTTLQVIGDAIHRDHATVMHSINSISRVMSVNRELKETVYRIKKELSL